MGPKKGPTAKKLHIAQELEALKVHMKACSRAHGLDYKADQNIRALWAIIEEKIEDYKSIPKLLFQGPEVGGPFAEMVCDMLAGYSKVKNLCFWGSSIGDLGLVALSDLLQGTASPWYKGAKIIHLEITCDGNRVPPKEWHNMSTAIRHTGINSSSVIQGPGAALPSLVFKDVPVVLAPDINIAEEGYEDGVDVTDRTGTDSCEVMGATIATFVSGAAGGQEVRAFGAPPPPYVFDGTLGEPLARPWGVAAMERLSNTLGTKGQRLKVLVLDHNLLHGKLIDLLTRGVARCSSIKQLSLAYCGLDADSTAALDRVLKTNTALFGLKDAGGLQLQHINLQGNQFEAEGLVQLSRSLIGNLTLNAMSLADVGVGEDDTEAITAFRESLMVHPCLFKVDFSMNPIGSSGVQLLLPMLEQRRNIKAFRVTNRIDRPTAKAFHELMIDRNVKKKKKKVLKKKKKTPEGAAPQSAADLLAGSATDQGGGVGDEFEEVEVEVEVDDDEDGDGDGDGPTPAEEAPVADADALLAGLAAAEK